MTHQIDNIKQSIDLILTTPRGERTMYPFWGANLSAFLFKLPSTSLANEIIQCVESALLDHEPRIQVNDVDVTFSDGVGTTVHILVDFTIKMVNARHNHVHPFSLIEATNLVSYSQNQ